MNEAWAINVRDQCLAMGIDFFFKQWGSWGQDGQKRAKKDNGRNLEGRTWDMIPLLNIA